MAKYITLTLLEDFATKLASKITETFVEKETGKGLSTNDYTAAEKEKLEGIAENANNYSHPVHTAKASGLYKVTVDANGHVSAAEAVTKEDITELGIPGSDTNTWNALKGATTSAAGTAGYAPAPAAGAANRYLRSDGKWEVPPNSNTTYSDMTGASASEAGAAGLVPAPAAGKQTAFLRGDGTWEIPPNTTYSAATQSKAGLMSAADKKKLDELSVEEANTDDIDAIIAGTFTE